MKLVEDQGRPREGGSCANCNSSYHAQNAHRVLAEYEDNGYGYVVEPFNLCSDCYEKMEKV